MNMEKTELFMQIDRIVAALTPEEKIRMIHGAGLFETGAVERLHIPRLKMSDGPMGVRAEFEKDRWVPAGDGADLVSYLPSNSAIAMTWNPALAYEMGRVLGEEARGRGKDVILAPGINVKRLANGGRNFEYLSEDPYLIRRMAVPLIQGIQTADVAACVKHFALNSQETERLWVNVEIDERALREIYLPAFEAAVKEAGAYSMMGAYNLLRGEHCCESRFLLGDILREEWGYDGAVISDWGGVHHTLAAAKSALDIEMSVTPDFDDYCMAGPLLAAIKNGEIEESCLDEKIRHILILMVRIRLIEITAGEAPLVKRNRDRKRGCYNTKEHRQAALEAARESVVLLKNEGQTLPFDPARAGRVLVIGDNAVRRQALGGGSAEISALYEKTPLLGIREFLGGNSEVVFAQGYETPVKNESGENWQAASLDAVLDGEKERRAREKRAQEQAYHARAEELRGEAVRLAGDESFDYVIFVGGLNHDYDVEGQDRESLLLPYEQDALIRELLAVRSDQGVVMLAGSPVAMQAWSGKAPAILWMSYSGMEGGYALAETIFGAVNPSGKLAESLPFSVEESSGYVGVDYLGRTLTDGEKQRMDAHLTQEYREGLLVGYRYYERRNVPVQFAFGHGLSYTSFSYGSCRVQMREYEVTEHGRGNSPDAQPRECGGAADGCCGGSGGNCRVWTGKCDEAAVDGKGRESGAQTEECCEVTVSVRNTGARAGKETVQVYVMREGAAEHEPVKVLAGFEKPQLLPGQETICTIRLDERAFDKYDETEKAWVRVPGNYRILIGSSSTDIRLRTQIAVAE